MSWGKIIRVEVAFLATKKGQSGISCEKKNSK